GPENRTPSPPDRTLIDRSLGVFDSILHAIRLDVLASSALRSWAGDLSSVSDVDDAASIGGRFPPAGRCSPTTLIMLAKSTKVTQAA
ncbi:MAG TPA: hypothetical protein PLY87_28755, partial [Planctomycetaceae bacterium]|nr:hypothetical protein [Planctomycetaceae bacterium]